MNYEESIDIIIGLNSICRDLLILTKACVDERQYKLADRIYKNVSISKDLMSSMINDLSP